jgi:hypothetical protein
MKHLSQVIFALSEKMSSIVAKLSTLPPFHFLLKSTHTGNSHNQGGNLHLELKFVFDSNSSGSKKPIY